MIVIYTLCSGISKEATVEQIWALVVLLVALSLIYFCMPLCVQPTEVRIPNYRQFS